MMNNLTVDRIVVKKLNGLSEYRNNISHLNILRSTATLEQIIISCGADHSEANVWPKLQYLCISRSCLRCLDDSFMYTPMLTEINLSFNHLEIVDHLCLLPNLSIVNLNSNHLKKIPTFHNAAYINMKFLFLQRNCVKDLQGLEKLANLFVFDARHNDIINFQAIQVLKSLDQLHQLFLEGNVIAGDVKYEVNVALSLNKISLQSDNIFLLDDIPLSMEAIHEVLSMEAIDEVLSKKLSVDGNSSSFTIEENDILSTVSVHIPHIKDTSNQRNEEQHVLFSSLGTSVDTQHEIKELRQKFGSDWLHYQAGEEAKKMVCVKLEDTQLDVINVEYDALNIDKNEEILMPITNVNQPFNDDKLDHKLNIIEATCEGNLQVKQNEFAEVLTFTKHSESDVEVISTESSMDGSSNLHQSPELGVRNKECGLERNDHCITHPNNLNGDRIHMLLNKASNYSKAPVFTLSSQKMDQPVKLNFSQTSLVDRESSDSDDQTNKNLAKKRRRKISSCNHRIVFNCENLTIVDHHIKLHCDLNIFKEQEELQFVLRGDYVNYDGDIHPAILILSNKAAYVLLIIDEESENMSNWTKVEHHFPIKKISSCWILIGHIGITFQVEGKYPFLFFTHDLYVTKKFITLFTNTFSKVVSIMDYYLIQEKHLTKNVSDCGLYLEAFSCIGQITTGSKCTYMTLVLMSKSLCLLKYDLDWYFPPHPKSVVPIKSKRNIQDISQLEILDFGYTIKILFCDEVDKCSGQWKMTFSSISLIYLFLETLANQWNKIFDLDLPVKWTVQLE